MSSTGVVTTQNYTHFYWTQEIWKKAWHFNDAYSLPSITAKIACIVFPILLSVAITEGIIWAVHSVFKVSSDPKITPLDAESVKRALPEIQQEKNPVPLDKPVKADVPVTEPAAPVQVEPVDDTEENVNICTVLLPVGSSLYDIELDADFINMKEERPLFACVYHAIEAAHFAAGGYYMNDVFQLIEFQRRMIKMGNRAYFAAVKKDPALKDAANLETILKNPKDLNERNLYFGPVIQEPMSIAVQNIAEHLFIPQDEPQMRLMSPRIVQIALINSSNNQTISAMCLQGSVLVFNSHKNEMTIIEGKEATQVYLTKILAPHVVMKEGVDQNPFSYALGQYDSITKRALTPE